MTKGQRKLLYRIFGLGLLLTLLVIAVDGLGGLDPLERYLYDLRARRFQFFAPTPSKQILHVDIDTQSIQEIGRWPWPRSVQAQLISEMQAAGAKVIALDILLSDIQKPELVQQRDGTIQRIDHDLILSQTLRRCANVLVPLSVSFRTTESVTPFHAAIVELLDQDPERTNEELERMLRERNLHVTDFRAAIRDAYVDAAAEAMFNRLEQELSAHPKLTLDELIQRVLPRSYAADEKSNPRILLERTYPIVVSVLSLKRFGQPLLADIAHLLAGQPEEAPLPALADAATFSGYVDFLPTGDGFVRAVPLCANYRGTLMPHMVLAIACAALGVDTKDVRYAQNSITIPMRDGPAIVIPVRTAQSDKFGAAGMFMDIPWFGSDDYTTMYDPPNYLDAKQHIPARNIWAVIELDSAIARNEQAADAAITSLLGAASSIHDAEAFAKIAPTLTAEARAKKIDELLNDADIKGNYEIIKQATPEEAAKMGDVERTILASYRTLLEIPEKSKYLRERQSQRRAALHDTFNGRAVMLGWTATGATDRYPTSLHAECPGVAIMGVAVNGILTRHLWTAMPWWISALITLLMGGLTSLAVARLSPVPALIVSAAMLAAYGAINGLLLFDYGDMLVPAAGTVMAVALCWSGLTLARFIIESRERRRITQRFSNYVDPALVDYVIENPEQVQLDGKVREMTVVFTDLAGFTTISEKLREKTVPILNEYMSLMVPIIREHSGYWDKFLGDGIMFFYNGLAPLSDHAIRAIDTAMEMQIVTQRFNARLRERQLPNVAMRAGISTGEMVVGDAGSKDAVHRANNFTVLGDAVNLGARLEGANKPIGTKILINGRTAELSEGKFLLRPIGNVRVVGKLEGVQLFEPLCRIETATDEQKKIVEFATTIVEAFADADFAECICAAKRMEETLGSTKFSQFYMRIAREHLENPTTDFEGQIVLSEK